MKINLNLATPFILTKFLWNKKESSDQPTKHLLWTQTRRLKCSRRSAPPRSSTI